MTLNRTCSKQPEQRLSILERTPLGAHKQRERARHLRDEQIGRVPDRRPLGDLIEQIGRFTLGRQTTNDSRGIDDRLSECHGRDG